MNFLASSQTDLESKLIKHVFCYNETLFLEYAKLSRYFVIKLTNELKIQLINEIAEEIYGWSLENIIGQDYNMLCKSYNFDSLLLNQQGAINQIFSTKLETYILRPTGEKLYLEVMINPIYHEDNKIKSILIIGKDITHIKKLAEKEQAIGLYLKEIFSHLPVAVWWKDQRSVFQGCNNFLAKVAGLSFSDEIKGKTDFDLAWHQDEALAFRKDDSQIMMTNKPKFGIIEPQHQAHGKCVTLFTSKIPIHDSSNNVIGTAGFFCDISGDNSINLIHLSNMSLKETYLSFHNEKNYYFSHKNKIIKLTKMQAECLTHLAMGKTIKEIAKLIKRSPRTVEDYIENLRNKLGALTKSQLAQYFWKNPIQWF